MNQQFLNRQYFQRNINTPFQGIGQQQHTIPNYQPMFIDGAQQLISPHSQFSPAQQLIQQQKPQQQYVPGPNQIYFLQNVPLVKSLPQNFSATNNLPTSQQQQNNASNQSNNSYGHVISSSRDYQQQQNKPQLIQFSPESKLQSINNIPLTNTGDHFFDKSLNNAHDIKSQSLQNGTSNDFYKAPYSSQANSTMNLGNFSLSKTQTTKLDLKTPEKAPKQQSYYQNTIVSPQSFQLSGKKSDNTQRLNTIQNEPYRIQQDSFANKLNTISQQQQDFQQSQNQQNAQFYDINKIIQLKNQSNITQLQNDSGLQNQNNQNNSSRAQLKSQYVEQQNYNSDQKLQKQHQITESINNFYTPDHKSNKDSLNTLKKQISKTEQSPNNATAQSEQFSNNIKMSLQNKSSILNGVKIPLELVYDGNSIIETPNPFNNITIQKKTPESIYHSSSKLQINDQNKKTLAQQDDDKDQINVLKQEIKQLNQENLTLKMKLGNKSNEYDVLFSKHKELEKKYIALQNQISQPSSSCNSSLIIQQEDKNQQILYDIANNKSQTKIPLHNHHTNHKNNFKKEQSHSKTFIPQLDQYQTQNKYNQSQTYNSPSLNNAYKGELENMSKLYQSVNFESQIYNRNPSVLHTSYPNNLQLGSPSQIHATAPSQLYSSIINQPYVQQNSQSNFGTVSQTQINVPSMLTIDDDYNYKKNTEKKIDQLLQKGLYSPQLNQSKAHENKFVSDQKQLTSSLQFNQSSFTPQTDPYKQNLIYSSRLSSNDTYQPINQFSLSKYQTNPSNYTLSTSTQLDYKNKLYKDTFLESFSNDPQSKNYITQYIAK